MQQFILYKQKIICPMRASRKQLINVTCKQGIRKRVDQFLTSEYQAWKQIKQPRRVNGGVFSCGTQHTNALIMDYVRYIYNQYNIPDPLENDIRFQSPQLKRFNQKQQIITLQSRKSMEQSNKNSPIMYESPIRMIQQSAVHKQAKFVIQQTPIHRRSQNRNQTTKKQANMQPIQQPEKTHHKRDNSNIIDRGTAYTNQRTDAMKSSNAAQIESDGRKMSKQSEQPIQNALSIQLYKDSQLNKNYPETYTPKQNNNADKTNYFKFSNKIKKMNSSNQKKQGQVSQTYRYCLACQKPVLDANVQIHQKTCAEFQKIYELDLDGILEHLSTKIQKLRQKVKNFSKNLQNNDSQMLKRMCQNLDQQCPEIVKSGKITLKFVNNYDNAIKVGKKWCETTQEINKLRWFLRVRQEIRIHFNL